MYLQIFSLFFLLFLAKSQEANDDKVTVLPGLSEKLNFSHYSGYLKASDTHFLHYWYVESQNDPKNDPVLLWLNGGPGCSSLDGLLSELGPFHIRKDGKTVFLNPHSWNKFANIIFLEAPVMVGFSYRTDGESKWNDDETSLDNFNALKDFFTNKFPKLINNDFFITGESYGGIYVPSLAVRILDGIRDFPLKFKGVAIGNGMMNVEMNTDSLMLFAYNHGLVDEHLWERLEHVCCSGCGDTCSFANFTKKSCEEMVSKTVFQVMETGLNMYDLYRDCVHPLKSASNFDRFWFDAKSAFPFMKQKISKLKNTLSFIQLPLNQPMDVPCLNDSAVTFFLNQKSVRESLHIPEDLGEWGVCSETVGDHYERIYTDMKPQVRKILDAGLRVLIYNGDTDMACNFMMGQRFSNYVGQKLLHPKRQWIVDKQIAGYLTQYENLDFVTVKGAGHMVPQWRAPQSLHMIKSFIFQQPY